MTKHTLEKIAEELGNKFDEEKLHAALLLAYTQTVYDVMRRNTVPSPLYRIIYDETTNNITLKETEGKSFVPEKNALDIDALDVVFICGLRGIPSLFVGETGTGKTYVCNGFLKTVFPRGSTFSLRLSGGAYESISRHFLKGQKDVGGMPKAVVDEEIINRTAGMLIDEPNRGDPDELLQLLDGMLFHDGQYYRIGVKIPEIGIDKKVKETDKRKKMIITSAINPTNAKYSGTVELDAAVDNRFAKFPYGNAADSAGSTLWLSETDVKNHDLFIQNLSKRIVDYLGIDKRTVENLKDDWLSIYAWITDPDRTEKRILYSALELADSMIFVLSGNLPQRFDYENEIANTWNDKLNLDIKINEKLPETENVKKIQSVIDTFKVPIIFRDIDQIKKLADVVATLENLRDAFLTTDPIKTYMKMPKYISIKEIAIGAALLARNKQIPNSPLPTTVINEVLNNYISLAEVYYKDMNYFKDYFDLYDPNGGIKKIAIVKGIRNMIKQSGGVDTIIGEIAANTKKLKDYISSSGDVRNVLLMRNIADLLTFAGFLDYYKDEIAPMCRKYNKNTDVSKVVNDLGNFYYNKREKLAIVLPEIYQHRIQRTLGI